MSITLNFWIFFFVIVVLALLGTAVIYLLVCPKAHTHYHYYDESEGQRSVQHELHASGT